MDEKKSILITSGLPLIDYIEKEQRDWVDAHSRLAGARVEEKAPSIVVRRTRGLKWIIDGEYGGAWVYHENDEADFRKLATAMYIFSKIRRSKFWKWWYLSVRKVDTSFASEGVTSAEWK
jgi:hypothetical protein